MKAMRGLGTKVAVLFMDLQEKNQSSWGKGGKDRIIQITNTIELVDIKMDNKIRSIKKRED